MKGQPQQDPATEGLSDAEILDLGKGAFEQEWATWVAEPWINSGKRLSSSELRPQALKKVMSTM